MRVVVGKSVIQVPRPPNGPSRRAQVYTSVMQLQHRGHMTDIDDSGDIRRTPALGRAAGGRRGWDLNPRTTLRWSTP